MRDKREFDAILRNIDGKDPSQYAALTGDFDFTRFVLHNLRVPEFAGGAIETLFVLHVPQIIAGFPSRLFDSPVRRTALEDFLTRKIVEVIDRQMLRAGDGFARNSLAISRPGAEILPRSALIVAHDYVEARITVRLPLVFRNFHLSVEQMFSIGITSILGLMRRACANPSISRITARLPRKEPVIDCWCTTRSSGQNATGTGEKPIMTSLPLFLMVSRSDVQSVWPWPVYRSRSKLNLIRRIAAWSPATMKWSAPRASASGLFAGDEEMAVTSQPSAWANWIARWPRPPTPMTPTLEEGPAAYDRSGE